VTDIGERASTHERLAESLLELARTLVASDLVAHNDGADAGRRVVGDRTMSLLSGDGPERLTLSVEEAAQVLGISRAHAYELAQQGEIPVIRLGRRILVPRVALAEMMRLCP
jgi:excisionase family DNA binding protein